MYPDDFAFSTHHDIIQMPTLFLWPGCTVCLRFIGEVMFAIGSPFSQFELDLAKVKALVIWRVFRVSGWCFLLLGKRKFGLLTLWLLGSNQFERKSKWSTSVRVSFIVSFSVLPLQSLLRTLSGSEQKSCSPQNHALGEFTWMTFLLQVTIKTK